MQYVAVTIKFFFLCVVLLGASITPLWAATIEGVRLWRSPDSTRLVFDLDASVEHTIFKLSDPQRLVIDVKKTRFAAESQDLKLANTPVIRVRHGLQKNGDLRIVLDLKEDINPRSFSLKRIADKPDRIVIDLHDKKQKTVKTLESIIQETKNDGKRDIVIAIDAGHGGEDPGAIGPGRLYEKDVVLKVAKNLANTINEVPGYKAVLVRDSDYYIVLDQRSEKARKIQADLFVSIHADGFDSPKARGASVFVLSRRGASSKMASILASKENQSDLMGGVERINLEDKEDQLKKILVDLSMTRSMETSTNIAERVLTSMGKVTHLHSSRVESAGFIVLKSADVPSILVETGYITNPQEAKKLNSLSHRTKLAKAIFSGIDSYFRAYPPEGSLFAWQKNGGRDVHYTITRGDTLSAIAKRFNVSVEQLKKENQLRSSSIRIGQKLMIPAI